MSATITVSLDERVLDRARAVAAERKTTVDGLVRAFLETLAPDGDRAADARRQLLELADRSQARLAADYRWNRDEIYEDRLFPRHERPDLRPGGEKR